MSNTSSNQNVLHITIKYKIEEKCMLNYIVWELKRPNSITDTLFTSMVSPYSFMFDKTIAFTYGIVLQVYQKSYAS